MSSIAELRTVPGAVPGIVQGLRRTFDSGRSRSRAWREAQLAGLDAMLTAEKNDLAGALSADLGKSAFESFLSEIGYLQKEIAHTRKHLARWMRPEKTSTPLALQPGKSTIVREPLGVVLIIAPWNYPLLANLSPLVAALAAGNCAVVKPSEVAAHTSEVVAKLVPRYLDSEAVAVVQGGVAEATALLEQRFDHIFYTGNGTVGRVVMTAAAKHLTPVTLELGGKSPTLVDATADIDVAARRIVWAKFFNAGQTCIAPDYILAEKKIEPRLVDALKRTIADFFGADPKSSRDYGRIINGKHHRRLVGLLGSGEVVCGGVHDEATRYIAPTVLRDVKADAPVMGEEIFGPILPVLTVDSMNDAVSFVNARPKPLALYVFSGERSVADDVLARTSSGGACVNDAVMHFAVPGLPFGGVGESGMGACHGKDSVDTFSHRKGVLARGSAMDLPLRYPPYDERKQTWLRRLM